MNAHLPFPWFEESVFHQQVFFCFFFLLTCISKDKNNVFEKFQKVMVFGQKMSFSPKKNEIPFLFGYKTGFSSV